MTKEDIAKYRALCLSLPGGEILNRYTDEVAAAICNGVGAAWTDRVAPYASGILNRALPWAVAPSIIHDLRYHEGIGGKAGRAETDVLFLAGCLNCIDDETCWPWMRRWRSRRALDLYLIVRKHGRYAWEGK